MAGQTGYSVLPNIHTLLNPNPSPSPRFHPTQHTGGGGGISPLTPLWDQPRADQVWEERETHNFSPEHHGLPGLITTQRILPQATFLIQKKINGRQSPKAFYGEDTLTCAS